MKFPLRITITTVFALFTTIVIVLVATLDFVGNRGIVLDSAKKSIARSVSSAEQAVDQLVSRATLTVNTIAKLPGSTFDWRSPDGLLGVLTVSLRNSPEIYGVFVGFANGTFVQAVNLVAADGSFRKVTGMPEKTKTAWRVIGPPDENGERTERWRYFDQADREIRNGFADKNRQTAYDPRTRPWFIASKKKQGMTLSGVYVFSSLKKPGVTVSMPLAHFPGAVIGVDLSLDDLVRLTARLRPGQNGVVAIVDGNGDVIAYPEPRKMLKPSNNGDAVELVPVSEIDDIRLREADRIGKKQNRSLMSFSVGDREYIAFSRQIAEGSVVDWRVTSVAAVSDFTGGLVAISQRSVIVAVIVSFGAIFAIAAMVGWITRPVIHLRDMADKITQLNLSPMAHFQSPFEEIKALQKSMEHMRGALDTFLRFVPRDIVRGLLETGQSATIGGSKQKITLLFTDVEGFTSLAERMAPEQVMSQMSEYFEKLSFSIQANRGTIDKFIGDGIMAMWNAPTEDEFHIENACRGTLGAWHISNDLNADFAQRGLPVMRTRFGLHTDDVVVGNVGARDRMQYTCLGSGVNLAARLEGLNKFYGTQILVSDAIQRKVAGKFLFRRIDIVEVKGATIPVTIFELMGERGEDVAFPVDEKTLKRASRYEQAFDLYLHQEFADALKILNQLVSDTVKDDVVEQLEKKCRDLLSHPPHPTWNGITVLDKK